MKRLILLLVISVMGAAFLAEAWGQIYQYTDKNGNVIFSDKPPVDSNAKEKQLKEEGLYWSNQSESDYTSDNESKDTLSAPSRRDKPKKDYSRVTAVMYMTDWCGYCKQAGQYIRSLGAGLIEYNIERDPSKKDEMKRISGGSSAVPLIDIDGTIIRGFSQGAIRSALDRSAAR
jgi:glutaredoxin